MVNLNSVKSLINLKYFFFQGYFIYNFLHFTSLVLPLTLLIFIDKFVWLYAYKHTYIYIYVYYIGVCAYIYMCISIHTLMYSQQYTCKIFIGLHMHICTYRINRYLQSGIQYWYKNKCIVLVN